MLVQEKFVDFAVIAPSFFGYAERIKKQIELRDGTDGVFFENRPGSDLLTKGLLRVNHNLVKAKSDEYFSGITDQLREHPVKDVLVIRGEALSVDALRKMREALPNARFTLYFWDSYLNMPPDSRDKVPLFDRTFTFDPIDAEQDSRLIYQPLFYLPEFAEQREAEKDIDLLFVGTAHSDRCSVVARVAKAIPEGRNFSRHLYLQSKWIYRTRMLYDRSVWGCQKSDFIFKPIGGSELNGLVSRSLAVLDVERAVQTGYTIRTIEMMAAGKKLVTTNPNIMRADFYSPDNITVIDRDRPVLSRAFFETPSKTISSDVLERYSLKSWVDVVVPLKKQGQS